MQKHFINFSFSISTSQHYGEIVQVSQSEVVPEGKCPVEYLRERLGSEIKRTTKDLEFEVENKV